MLSIPTHLKQALWVLILAVMALAIACGSGDPAATAPPQSTAAPAQEATSPPAPTSQSTETATPTTAEEEVQPKITTTPAGERSTPPERPQAMPASTQIAPTQTATPLPTKYEIPIPADTTSPSSPSSTIAPTPEHPYEGPSKATDRTVLELLYEQTGGNGWENNENWMTEAPMEEWYGITTNAQGRVTKIELTANELRGNIPLEIGKLSQLEILYLGGNYGLGGEIPPEIGNLSNLQELSLIGHNQVHGQIPPEIGNLSNLRVLLLSFTSLSGAIPVELANLEKLETLNLRHNNLGFFQGTNESATVPQELGNLPNLTVILINPQPYMPNACIPAKLRGQLRTDLPAHLEITPFCDE